MIAKNHHGDPLAWLEDEIAYSIPRMICSELSMTPKEFAEGPPYDTDHSKLRAKYGLPRRTALFLRSLQV
jgi:hypothetical protein